MFDDSLEERLRRRNRGISSPDMDMTPMVDVTFLLLIFFMVTAAFALQKSFRAPLPQSDQATANPRTLEEFEDDARYIVVRLDAFDTYHVTASSWTDAVEAPSPHDLIIQLRNAREASSREGEASRMLLICHGDAHHERVIQALDAGHEVGLEDIKMVAANDDAAGDSAEL
ncbi:MAG TPA: biopolymer transporter ExbD [Pirellulaceae bacterium]